MRAYIVRPLLAAIKSGIGSAVLWAIGNDLSSGITSLAAAALAGLANAAVATAAALIPRVVATPCAPNREGQP